MKALFLLLLLLIPSLALAAVDQISEDLNDPNVGTTSTVHFATSPTAGCLVVLGFVAYNASNVGTPTIVDNQSQSYTVITYSDPNARVSMPLIAYREATAASVTDITITHVNSSDNYIRARAVSICGETAIDRAGEATETDNTSTTVSGSAENTNAADFIFAVVQPPVPSIDVHLATLSAGYINLMIEQNYTDYVAGSVDYKEVSALETSSITWTHDFVNGGSGLSSYALIATFKLGGAPPAAVRKHNVVFQ